MFTPDVLLLLLHAFAFASGSPTLRLPLFGNPEASSVASRGAYPLALSNAGALLGLPGDARVLGPGASENFGPEVRSPNKENKGNRNLEDLNRVVRSRIRNQGVLPGGSSEVLGPRGINYGTRNPGIYNPGGQRFAVQNQGVFGAGGSPGRNIFRLGGTNPRIQNPGVFNAGKPRPGIRNPVGFGVERLRFGASSGLLGPGILNPVIQSQGGSSPGTFTGFNSRPAFAPPAETYSDGALNPNAAAVSPLGSLLRHTNAIPNSPLDLSELIDVSELVPASLGPLAASLALSPVLSSVANGLTDLITDVAIRSDPFQFERRSFSPQIPAGPQFQL